MNLLPSIPFIIIGSDPILNAFTANFIATKPNTDSDVFFRVDQVFKLLMRDQNPCQMDGNKFDCITNCFIKAVWKECKCVPLAAVHYDTPVYDKQFCVFNNNSDTCVSNMPFVINKCRNQCSQLCVNTFTSFTVMEIPTPTNTTSVRLLTDSFIYPIFFETLQMQPRQFLAQLGGNLSFWIGASFLALLHIVVSLVRVPFAYQNNKSANVNNN